MRARPPGGERFGAAAPSSRGARSARRRSRLRPYGLLVQTTCRQRLLDGNFDPEARAGRQRVEADPPAVGLDDAARDGKSEPGAGDALSGRAAAIEGLEDLFAVLRRDPRPLVVDPDSCRPGRLGGPD